MKVFCAIFVILGALGFIHCKLPAECLEEPTPVAQCRAMRNRYSYNPAIKSCVQFNDGGCARNRNNFPTFDECKNKCITIKTKPKFPCDQTPGVVVEGPCRASIRIWIYYHDENICKMIAYGRCAGNRNSFINKSECESKCLSTTPK